MGFLDKIFGGGGKPEQQRDTTQQQYGGKVTGAPSEDEAAIARYRYMLKTAPPETIEQAHAEAFARLTPQQRQMVLKELQEDMPEAERNALAGRGDDPQTLARAATRAEMRQPGTMESMLGRAGGAGFGGMLAGSLLGSIAGTVIGSYIAQEFFANDANSAGIADNVGEQQADLADASGEADFFADDGGGDFDNS